MVRFIKRILSIKWAILGLLTVVVTYLLLNSLVDDSEQKVVFSKKERPMIIMNPVLREYEDEKINLKLVADKAEVYEKKQSTILLKPVAKLFDSGDVSKVTIIRANTGKYQNKKDQIHLWGNVRIEFHDGQRLFTEELFVNSRKKVIYNTVKVKVISGSEVINAASMRYTMNNEVLVLKRPKALLSI